MMIEKKETFKILREQHKVPESVKENLKDFNKIKRSILLALKEEDLTVAELSGKLQIPADEIVYYLLSLVKFGFVKTGEIDSMDEYFKYKLK